ncbi:uncharacterized protein LOC142162415 [Nicotiana tabacum]|uniref:Uncharacterized protein LOC142162415 n=1 Tax=Nicotiana tabacum TaxID=4097 RepID=A0AC58RQ47_TOBAC
MINNNEDEVNMELIPITSHRIEEIAESSCASQKSRKRVRRKVKESPPCKILRHDALPEEVRVGSIFGNKQNMTKFFRSLEINQKVEFTAVRLCSKRYELKCIVDKCEHVRDKKIEVTPAFVENEMKKKFGIDIGYHKAWHAIQKVVACIRGTPKENYQILPSYLHMMEAKNSGTYTSIKRDSQNRFAYLFFAHAASVADSENNEAYIWFFGEMRKTIQVRHELVFLSDRNQSIANGIRKVFPEAHHGICLYHFEKYLKQRHAKATVINLLQSAARSYKRKDFNQLMSQLKSIDKKTYNSIMEEPPERWARSWFPQRRYDMLTTNMVESMNFVLLKGREMSILRMLDFIQEKLGEWFYERRKKVFNLDLMLFRINSEGIEFIVDLKNRTCDCLEFQLDELPSPHAIAAINKRYLQKSDYCSNWYSRETWLKTYEGHLNIVGDQKSWKIPQNVHSKITKPPDVEILQGRRQKKRHIPATESSVPFKSTKYSRCKQVGHNRTTCLSSPVPHPYSKKHTENYSKLQ